MIFEGLDPYLIGKIEAIGIWNLKRIGTLKFGALDFYLVGLFRTRLEFGIWTRYLVGRLKFERLNSTLLNDVGRLEFGRMNPYLIGLLKLGIWGIGHLPNWTEVEPDWNLEFGATLLVENPWGVGVIGRNPD